MVFSSILFLFYFFPIFILIYSLLPYAYKNKFLLLASGLFYAWGAPVFVFVVSAVIGVDYYVVNHIYQSDKKRTRRYLLALSIMLKLGLLIYFKYANFFVENFNLILNAFHIQSVEWTKTVLPIGISFFTFQAITYSVDVYRKVHAPLRSVGDYLLYILLFPQLIAGPIVRYNEVADQIIDRRENETHQNRVLGFYRFVIGLSKKVLVANTLGEQADIAFSLSAADLSTSAAWIGMLAYTFQIYFDFSGYSDMAIGLGRMMGFKFPENFDNPYISRSITEFWRRWHITLGRFMKDYLYIPLGGNRVSKERMYFNLILVFALSGFWHGAEWNFILWGLYHGLFLILDRLFLLKWYEKIHSSISIIITLFLSMFGWVIFRAESFEQIQYYFKALFRMDFTTYSLSPQFVSFLVIAFIISLSNTSAWGQKIQHFLYFKNDFRQREWWALSAFIFLLFFLSVSFITASGFNPFIYFRF